MMSHPPAKPSRTKALLIFILSIIVGYALFIIPDLFFGITKLNGGKIGINLALIALFQFVSVTLLLHVSLNLLKKDWRFIGLKFQHLKRDVLTGLLFGGLWAALQFVLIIPNTGGADRTDIKGMLDLYDGSLVGTLSFIALGVIGGGITEELFNRGYFISVLEELFKNKTLGLWFAATFSILLFAMGHLPSKALDWFDILVPTIMYTLLFISTRRLTAPIVAHGLYNMLAILLTYHLYY